MRYMRTLLFLAAAEILSLFIGLTLAGTANPLVRVISAICTSGIMICLMASLALKTVASDRKNKSRKGDYSLLFPAGMTFTALVPPFVSWIILKITAGGSIDFYRWHKLINGWFLQVYNLIEPDASSAALNSAEIWGMLPLACAPAAVFAVFYALGYKGIINLEK